MTSHVKSSIENDIIEQFGEKIDQQKARKKFQKFLEDSGLDEYIDVDLVQEWMKNFGQKDSVISKQEELVNILFGLSFAKNKMDFVVKNGPIVLEALYLSTPQKRFKNKSPQDVEDKESREELDLLPDTQDLFLTEVRYFNEALELIHKEGRLKEARNKLEKGFSKLLKSKKVIADPYRPFANLAVCYLAEDEGRRDNRDKAERLIRWALELNPNYSIGLELLERIEMLQFVEIKKDISERVLLNEKINENDSDIDERVVVNKEINSINKLGEQAILDRLKSLGVSVNKRKLLKSVRKHYTIEKYLDEVVYPQFCKKYDENDRRIDVLWPAIKKLWLKWRLDGDYSLEEFFDLIFKLNNKFEDDGVDQESLNEVIDELNEYIKKAPAGLLKKFTKYPLETSEFIDGLIDVISMDCCKDVVFEIAKVLDEKSGDNAFSMFEVLQLAENDEYWRDLYWKIVDSEKYSINKHLVYVKLLEFSTIRDAEDIIDEVLWDAMKTVRRRDEDKVFDTGNLLDGTIFSAYQMVLSLFEDALDEDKQVDEARVIKATKKNIKEREEELSYFPGMQEIDEKMTEIIDNKLNKSFGDDYPVKRYYNFLKKTGINFETKELTNEPKKFIHDDGSNVGRNEKCPCGSGKKYKKCCL